MITDDELNRWFSLRPLTHELTASQNRIAIGADPNRCPGPLFVLIRGTSSVVWGVWNDVPREIANELDRLAREEPPVTDFHAPPLHLDAYLSLISGQIASGPAFGFPDEIDRPTGITVVDRLDLLERHFHGWIADEIPSCSPIMAVTDSGYPVSVCFCASGNSRPAVEAGVETAAAFRRRGFAARVTAAWAGVVRMGGRIPVYSTDWSNAASLGVARKLGLIQYAKRLESCCEHQNKDGLKQPLLRPR